MGTSIDAFVVMGIKSEMPSRMDEEGGLTPILPNGRQLSTFSVLANDTPKLEASLELMGDPGKHLIGYKIGHVDHHNAFEVNGASDPRLRTQLLTELKDAGMQVDDSQVKLYVYLDSGYFEH